MSALDGRIRSIAREEATAAVEGIKSPSAEIAAAGGPAQTRAVEQETASLRAQVDALTARLDALEKAVAPTAVAKRAARKPGGTSA